jgi:hypothetical protein
VEFYEILSIDYSGAIYLITGVIGFGAIEIIFVGGGTLGPATFLTIGGGTSFLGCSTTGYLSYCSFNYIG